MKRISSLLSILLLICILICANISAFASSEYYINTYNVDMVVNDDNSIDVTESISAYFNTEKHGIYRYIPIDNTVTRSDSTEYTKKAKVTNVSVNEPYSTYTEDGNYVIQIGDENKTHTGEMNYTIKYKYLMGREANEGFDELYYNIIGSGWDAVSKYVTFSITMPKNFDQSKLGFSKGTYGTVGNDNNVEYTVEGNKITGKVVGALSPNEALTVRLELDDGYFTFDEKAYMFQLLTMVALPLVALAVAVILWAKYGRDKKIVDVVEFYPPENMNSAQVAMWNKGYIQQRDTVGLLLELANEGYVSISEEDGEKSNTKIIKERSSYTGGDKQKREFFDGLFPKNKKSVTVKELEEDFYKTATSISEEINLMRKKVFDPKSLVLRIIGWAVAVVTAALSIVFCNSILGDEKKYAFCAIGVGISVLAFVISCFVRRRTDEGHLYKQQINGFKTFLETAEKERLEALVYENPSYFYNILPFAYVLGVSDKWIKKFEGIAMEPPRWYYGYNYSPMTMYYFMHRSMNNISRVMSTPNIEKDGLFGSSSGGSFGGGGGGFAGGGFGGGGGGSW